MKKSNRLLTPMNDFFANYQACPKLENEMIAWFKALAQKQHGRPFTQTEWTVWLTNYQHTNQKDLANAFFSNAPSAAFKGCVIVIEEHPL
jgi:hypothetical protein